MQVHYDVTKLTLRYGAVGPALPSIERALGAAAADGRAIGVFVAEIGTLNQVLIVRGLDDAGTLARGLDARQRRGDLFGVDDQLIAASASTFASFPFLPRMPAGRFGPLFEVREYGIKYGALSALLASWEAAVPARAALSPLLLAAYALDGELPRILHVWPYTDLHERARIRAEAVARGVWPPKGGADQIVTMRSSIYLAAPFSPLQ